METENEMVEVLPASAEVVIINRQAKATSLAIAKAFDKNHRDVLKSIRNLECSEEFTERNFAPSEYTDPTGRKLPMYELTRDGAVFLIMGYTGKEAARFKEAYINAFNRMESEIHGIWREAAETGYQKAVKDIEAFKRITQAFTPLGTKQGFETQLPDFVAFADALERDKELNKTDEFTRFKQKYPQRNNIYQRTFTKWLRKYAEHNNISLYERQSHGASLFVLSTIYKNT